jgi:hypothetical protein
MKGNMMTVNGNFVVHCLELFSLVTFFGIVVFIGGVKCDRSTVLVGSNSEALTNGFPLLL